MFSPLDPGIIYTSSQHLWRTTDEGHSWESISPDLTRADPKTLGDSGGPITKDQNGPEIYGTIFTIAPSRKEKDTIWTGSDDGVAYITRDAGKHWTNITPPDLPEFSRISLIEASPNNAGTAYLAAKRYQLDDRRPYLYKTADYGKTWSKIVNGIREDDYVHAVREDPKRAGLLFAGTEHGIYVSFDDGAQWQSLSLNLPDTQVPDLLIEGDDLVIATHGRSFYVLPDIEPLRQMSPELNTATAHLFMPPTAVRNVQQAEIDYYLKQPSDKVVIDILDSKGDVVRTFTGTPEDDKKKKGADGEEDPDEEYGPPKPKPVPRKAGLNRFVWDLRYPGATGFKGLIFWGARVDSGPFAVPGTYQIRLSANGQTMKQALVVTKDPRIDSVTIADLTEQFNLAMQVRDKVTTADEMVILIRELKKQMQERLKSDPSLKPALEAFEAKLSGVEEDVYQVRNRSDQDPLNFPIKLNNRLAALGRSIETGDGKPTAGAYKVFGELSKELDAQQARLDEILKLGLPEVNRSLTEHKLKELKPTKIETETVGTGGTDDRL